MKHDKIFINACIQAQCLAKFEVICIAARQIYLYVGSVSG